VTTDIWTLKAVVAVEDVVVVDADADVGVAVMEGMRLQGTTLRLKVEALEVDLVGLPLMIQEYNWRMQKNSLHWVKKIGRRPAGPWVRY